MSDKELTVEEQARKKVDYRARAKKDRLFLANEILGYDFQTDTHTELFAQYPTFDENKAWVEQSVQKNVLVLWPRGHYKTTAIVVVIIQAILNNPDIRVLLMQGSIKVTKNLLKEVASHFLGDAANSKLIDLFPEFCGSRHVLKASAESFTVPARRRKQLPQATVTVASPRSIKTGQHYDLGIFDDLVNDQNYKKLELLAKVETDFNDCQPLIDPGCYRFVSGTRYAFGDLYENILRRNKGEWTTSVKTCWSDEKMTIPRFPQRKLEDGRFIGFTAEMLHQIRQDTPGLFASQYLNSPVLEGSQIFTEEKMLSAVIAEKDSPALTQPLLIIDVATAGDDDSDDSVILAVKLDVQGRVYIVDGIGGCWNTPDLAIKIIEMSLKHRPLRVMFEKSAAGEVFSEYLKVIAKDKGLALPIDFIPVDNRKDAKLIRTSNVEGLLRNRRLFFFVNIPCWAKILEQFKQFPKGRHDDYRDTVALATKHFDHNYVPMAPGPQRSHNPMIALLERDVRHEAIVTSLNSEVLSEPGSMGSDFCC